jgi:hypothetical protein
METGFIKDEEDFQPTITGLEFFVMSFRELNTCRNSSDSPIPFTSVKEYWNCYPEIGVFEEFLFFIRLMDDTLLNLESNKRSSDNKGK